MKINYRSFKPAHFRVGVILIGVICLAGCSSVPAAGSLDASPAATQQSGASFAPQTQTRPPSEGVAPNGTDAADEAVSDQGTAATVSQERRRVVSDAVARFVGTLPGARLISTRVLNEARSSSAAIAVVVRSGARQVLAISAQESDGSWIVRNVDTIPNAQDAR